MERPPEKNKQDAKKKMNALLIFIKIKYLELLFIVFLILRTYVGIVLQINMDLFFDNYNIMAEYLRQQFLNGNFLITSDNILRVRLIYPLLSALLGLILPYDINTVCAICNIIFQNTTLILIYCLVMRIYGKKITAFYASILCSFAVTNFYYIWAGMTEATALTFMLLSCFQLINYNQNRNYKNLIKLLICLIFAALTREELIMLAAIPIINQIFIQINRIFKHQQIQLKDLIKDG